jgi:quercetin dioxygenase-like cupin family protein
MKAQAGQTVAVVGDSYRFLVVGEQTGGALAMMDFVVPPNHGPPPHVHHRENEIFYILEGEIEFIVAGQTLRRKAGETLLAKRDIPHTFRNATTANARMLVTVTPAGLEDFFLEVGALLPGPDAAAPEPTQADIARLVATAPKYGLEIFGPG